MHHNKLFLPLLLISAVLFSCATTEDSSSSAENAQTIQPVPEVAAESGTEAAASSLPEEMIEDNTAEEVPEPAEDSVEASSEQIESIETPAPVKEVRKGGRKPSLQAEGETPVGGADVSEAEETDEADGIVFEDAVEYEADPVEAAPVEESPEEPIIEEPVKDSGDEEEFSVTVVNEISMDPQSADLPSERDEIDYNPLLPIVVDAPSVSRKSDSNDEQDMNSGPAAKNVEEAETHSSSPASPRAPVITESEPDISTSEKDEISDIDSEDLEELYVDSTGKLIIELQGTGWIYLSSDDNDSLSLNNKSYNPDSGTTRFVFTSSSSTGPEGKLIFMKQDLLKGENSQKSLSLEGRLSSEPESDSTAMDESGKDSDPVSEDSISPEISSSALQPDSSKGPEQISTEISTADPGDQEDLLPEDAAGLLRLAERYEAPGPEQSLERALELYNRIKIEFPVTEERFIAETRIRYLNKHYFKVQ